MNIQDLFEEVRNEDNILLEEIDIKRKGKKFLVTKDGKHLEGTREQGYLSLENAIKDMFNSKRGNTFGKLSFEKKKKKIDDFASKWKEKNKVSDKKKKLFGFEEIE